jgi:hypothetical protein
MLGRMETVIEPGDLTVEDLMSAAGRIQQGGPMAKTNYGGGNGKN